MRSRERSAGAYVSFEVREVIVESASWTWDNSRPVVESFAAEGTGVFTPLDGYFMFGASGSRLGGADSLVDGVNSIFANSRLISKVLEERNDNAGGKPDGKS